MIQYHPPHSNFSPQISAIPIIWLDWYLGWVPYCKASSKQYLRTTLMYIFVSSWQRSSYRIIWRLDTSKCRTCFKLHSNIIQTITFHSRMHECTHAHTLPQRKYPPFYHGLCSRATLCSQWLAKSMRIAHYRPPPHRINIPWPTDKNLS